MSLYGLRYYDGNGRVRVSLLFSSEFATRFQPFFKQNPDTLCIIEFETESLFGLNPLGDWIWRR